MSLPDRTYRVGVLLRHNLVLVARDPGHLIAYLVMPMVLMAVQAPLYQRALRGVAGTTQVVSGMLVMFSLLALSIVGNAVLAERTWRTWDRLRATPAGAGELMVGKAAAVFAVLLLQQLVLLGFGAGALRLRLGPQPALLVLPVLCWAAALLAGGTALAVVVRGHGQLSAACDVGGLLLAGLGGALAPPSAMPDWARTIAPISPGYWAMGGLHAALAGDVAGSVRDAAVLLALALAAGAIAVARMRRGWTRAALL